MSVQPLYRNATILAVALPIRSVSGTNCTPPVVRVRLTETVVSPGAPGNRKSRRTRKTEVTPVTFNVVVSLRAGARRRGQVACAEVGAARTSESDESRVSEEPFWEFGVSLVSFGGRVDPSSLGPIQLVI